MAFGALKPCEECKGQLAFKSDAYYCTGDISAWTKCVFKTQAPNRVVERTLLEQFTDRNLSFDDRSAPHYTRVSPTMHLSCL